MTYIKYFFNKIKKNDLTKKSKTDSKRKYACIRNYMFEKISGLN